MDWRVWKCKSTTILCFGGHFFDVFLVFMAICFFITFNTLKENDICFEGFVFLAGWVGLAVKYVIDSGLMLKCGREKGR